MQQRDAEGLRFLVGNSDEIKESISTDTLKIHSVEDISIGEVILIKEVMSFATYNKETGNFLIVEIVGMSSSEEDEFYTLMTNKILYTYKNENEEKYTKIHYLYLTKNELADRKYGSRIKECDMTRDYKPDDSLQLVMKDDKEGLTSVNDKLLKIKTVYKESRMDGVTIGATIIF